MAAAPSESHAPRIVRIDGQQQSSSGILADYVEMVWVTPAMDGLFTGPAAERRRFLDRLILCFDAGYRTIAGRFERAMTARNRLLADGVRDNAQLEGLELQMAESGIAIAAARAEAVAALTVIIETRRAREPGSAFPWSTVAIDGAIERDLATHPAVDVEDAYVANAADDARTRPRRRPHARRPAPLRPHRRPWSQGHARPARLDGGAESAAARARAGACRTRQPSARKVPRRSCCSTR